MDVRPYLSSDRDACLAIFDSNTPHFFAAQNRGLFEEFLDHPNGSYFVMEHDGTVVGCGGYTITPEDSLSRLVWGMVHHDWRRKGLGRFLLLFRLREITKAGGIQMVVVTASRDVAPFFESQGFKIRREAGPESVELTMKLTVCP